MNKFLNIIILMFGVFISAVSQVLLKKAANKTYSSWIREYLNAPVIIAYGIFFLSTFLTIIAYRVVPLSLGAVLEATSYIYITVFGVTIFRERVTIRKNIALLLILFGIVISAIFG